VIGVPLVLVTESHIAVTVTEANQLPDAMRYEAYSRRVGNQGEQYGPSESDQ